jgi:glycosyltransferase involved in cell wall biosynthesis
MRILHVYKDYFPILGGIENHMKTVAEAQAAAGHDVTVLVTNPGGELSETMLNGVRVLRVGRIATVASTPISPLFPLRLALQKPDITHLHFPYPVGEVSQLLGGNGRNYVITYHSDIVKQQAILRWYKPLLRRVLQKADTIIATSDRYIASSPFLSPLAEKCAVVPLAVDPKPFAKAAPLIDTDDKPTLLFLGQHRYYKGVGDLIQAMTKIEAKLLVGGDGPMRETWQAMSNDLGVADKVQFLGRVPDADLPGLYASADMFVLPANARAEAFGKVLLEAMASSLPCITTEVGTGTSFVVQDEVSGLVVAPNCPEELVTAVNTLIYNPALRQEMGSAGRQRVLNEFTPDLMVSRLQAIYEKILN